MLRRLKGQSTLEYAMIIAVVVGALLAIHIYVRRSVQGRLRESIDSVGSQYSAGNVTSTVTIEQIEEKDKKGFVTKETFGLEPGKDEGGKEIFTFKQGVSSRQVVTAAEVKRSATGDEAEKITKTFDDEPLFSGKKAVKKE